MTLTDRVLRNLEETRGEWRLKECDGEPRLLRREDKKDWRCYCPLESALGMKAMSLGYDSPVVELHHLAIMRAADGRKHEPTLRAAMLEAAGLAEEA